MEDPVGLCTTCLTWGATLRCSRCKGDMYCNEECQGKDWKAHRKACSKPDAARRKLDAMIRPAVDDVPKLLDLSPRLDRDRLLQPGNQYLQMIVRLACVLNGITEAKSSAEIAAVDLRFSCLAIDMTITGRRYTVLQLRTACPFTEIDMPVLAAPDTKAQRATADAALHDVTGVRDDPTCCHIPLVFGSNHPTERMSQASHVHIFFVPVLPGVAKQAVQEMKESGKSVMDWVVGELMAKFNTMVIHDKVCGSRGTCMCAQMPVENWKSWPVE